MRFSIWPSNTLRPSELVAVAVAAEQHGFHRFLVSEHFLPISPTGRERVADCWTVLAAAAVATTEIELASLVTPTRYHHLPVLANAIHTVSELAAGRITAGLGAGWQSNEHTALELALGDISTRTAHLDHAARWLAHAFEGHELRDPPCQELDNYPGARTVPILIGGSGRTSTIPVAARRADQWNSWSTPGRYRALAEAFDTACHQLDREPNDVDRSCQFLVSLSGTASLTHLPPALAQNLPTVHGDTDTVRRAFAALAEAGCDEFILPLFAATSVGAALADLAAFRQLFTDQWALQ